MVEHCELHALSRLQIAVIFLPSTNRASSRGSFGTTFHYL
jgi:hypothetical protein